MNYIRKVSLNDILEKINFVKDVLWASKKAFGAGITLNNNGIKDIVKVLKSLENRGILLKGTTRKITSQEGEFLNFLISIMTAGLPLMKNVLTPLAKNVLLSLGLSAGMPAEDAAIQKKIYGSRATASIISKEEMEDIIESGLLIKGISEKFLPMLLETSAASMLGSALTGKGVIRAGKSTIRAGENFYCRPIF